MFKCHVLDDFQQMVCRKSVTGQNGKMLIYTACRRFILFDDFIAVLCADNLSFTYAQETVVSSSAGGRMYTGNVGHPAGHSVQKGLKHEFDYLGFMKMDKKL